MKLVIVESPTKKKTIQKYLGKDYLVEASVGHIRDIANVGDHNLGINISDGSFLPTYAIIKGKDKTVNTLKTKLAKCDEVYLASDPDREGEAISWHLAQVLDLDINTTKRLEFHEITHQAILNALENTRTININTVNAQETRKVLDKIVGYLGSGVVQRDVHAMSIGRVQTAVLKLIDNKENEINSFVPVTTYNAYLTVKDDKGKESHLYLIDEENKKIVFNSEKEALKALDQLSSNILYKTLIKKEKVTKSFAPYTTSSLQVDANIKLKYSVKKVAAASKELFYTGLISYPRTDSIRLAPEFINKAKSYIQEKFGEEYVGVAKVQGLSDKVQDAHEAIRITSFDENAFDSIFKPENKQYKEFKKIYDLIFNRTIQSIMTPRIDNELIYLFESNGTRLGCFGRENVFKGFSIVDGVDEDLFIFENSYYEFDNKKTDELVTKPAPRFTEGTLVKEMEKTGIGRPSTYESTISKCHTNNYIKVEKNYIYLTELGKKVIDFCSENFSTTVSNIEYTAEIEKKLDEVESCETTKLDCIKSCYDYFMNEYNKVKSNPNSSSLETGELCPLCGHKLVRRFNGRNEFVGCSNYPNCRYIKPDLVGRNCPDCGKPLVYRSSSKGKFVACSGYPACTYHEFNNNKKKMDK